MQGIPLVILCGEAGSGKDSAGNFMASHYNGICIGQADPLKWIARDIFAFTEEQLFGPSECRNAIDSRYRYAESVNWKEARDRFDGCLGKWCRELFPDRLDTAINGMKLWFQACLPWAVEHNGLSPRYTLQTLGTEWGRALDASVWVKYAIKNSQRLLGGGFSYNRQHGLIQKVSAEAQLNGDPNIVIITDGRFKNEILEVKSAGGIAVKVYRPNNLSAEAQTAGVVGHASEKELGAVPPHFYDYVINNNSDLVSLHHKGEFVANKLTEGPRWIYLLHDRHGRVLW